jgi:protein-S-isoprenylcysteine O-methyltransferase Ste14
MFTIYQLLTILFWIAHEVFWAAHARGNKETASKGKILPRVFALLAIYVGFALLYVSLLSIGVSGARIVPENDFFGTAGVIMCGSGIFFAWWSRKALGTNWSAPITLKKDHEFIQHGPYAIVRHPIYSGSIFAFLGSAVAMTELRRFIAVAIVSCGLLQKIRGEEEVLEFHFSDYAQYKLRVKKLIPFVY